MKKYSLFTLGLLLAAGSAVAELPAGWSTNYPAALAKAQASQQPLLVYFTASWCGPCKLMALTTLTNDAVVQALSGLSHVAVDIDLSPDLTEQHAVRAVPTFEMLTPNGDEVVRATGYQEAEQFVAWLTDSVAKAKAAVVRQNQFKAKLAEIDRLLAGNDPAAMRQAADALFDLCDERDTVISRAAADRLKTLATRDPVLLLGGLSDPRLATRIQVANALRARLGPTFDIDPWSLAPVREEAVEKWRLRLPSTGPAKQQ